MELTKAEKEVIDMVIQGFSNRQIAANLHKSTGTIKCHVQNILRKLGAKNRTHLAYIIGAMKSDD